MCASVETTAGEQIGGNQRNHLAANDSANFLPACPAARTAAGLRSALRPASGHHRVKPPGAFPFGMSAIQNCVRECVQGPQLDSAGGAEPSKWLLPAQVV
jgi:hypothetical protein